MENNEVALTLDANDTNKDIAGPILKLVDVFLRGNSAERINGGLSSANQTLVVAAYHILFIHIYIFPHSI